MQNKLPITAVLFLLALQNINARSLHAVRVKKFELAPPMEEEVRFMTQDGSDAGRANLPESERIFQALLTAFSTKALLDVSIDDEDGTVQRIELER